MDLMSVLKFANILLRSQLAENYTTFFEKLTQSLDELAREMDFFSNVEESIASLNSSEKQRMAAVLEDVFEDLLLYLTGVMRIFFKGDGSKSCLSSA
jgi:hypothetical protein